MRQYMSENCSSVFKQDFPLNGERENTTHKYGEVCLWNLHELHRLAVQDISICILYLVILKPVFQTVHIFCSVPAHITCGQSKYVDRLVLAGPEDF